MVSRRKYASGAFRTAAKPHTRLLPNVRLINPPYVGWSIYIIGLMPMRGIYFVLALDFFCLAFLELLLSGFAFCSSSALLFVSAPEISGSEREEEGCSSQRTCSTFSIVGSGSVCLLSVAGSLAVSANSSSSRSTTSAGTATTVGKMELGLLSPPSGTVSPAGSAASVVQPSP